MLRGRVPVGHPWAMGTIRKGGRRCIIDTSSWMYSQRSNKIVETCGIVWSVPPGKTPPVESGDLSWDLTNQVILDMNWIDVTMRTADITRNVFVKGTTILDIENRTKCFAASNDVAGLSVTTSVDFVYPNTLIKRFGENTIIYETITPLEYEKTLLTWSAQHLLGSRVDAQFATMVESVHDSGEPLDPFQERILDRLGGMVVDDTENTFVVL